MATKGQKPGGQEIYSYGVISIASYHTGFVKQDSMRENEFRAITPTFSNPLNYVVVTVSCISAAAVAETRFFLFFMF